MRKNFEKSMTVLWLIHDKTVLLENGMEILENGIL